MLTLQTCTPIATFEKRLIVRADRVYAQPPTLHRCPEQCRIEEVITKSKWPILLSAHCREKIRDLFRRQRHTSLSYERAAGTEPPAGRL